MIALALTLGMGLIGPVWASSWNNSLTLITTVNTGHMTQSGDVIFSQVDQRGNIISLDAKSAHRIFLEITGVKSIGEYSVSAQILNQASSIPVCFITGKPGLIENKYPEIIDVQYQLSNPKAMVGGSGLDIGDTDNGLIIINVKDDTIPGTYPFKITLPCVQYNATDIRPGEWNDTFQIDGTVEVLPQRPAA